mgnify:CR=1 FL=1
MNVNEMDCGEILMKALAEQRIRPDEAACLSQRASLLDLAAAAGELVRRVNPAGEVGYTVNRTVVYSNVCDPQCPYCRGTVTRDDPRAFTLTPEEAASRAAEAAAQGATQIILQGGHRTDLPWEYYLELVRTVKERLPQVQVMGFSPTEITVLRFPHEKSICQMIGDLKVAGLGAMWAGGAPSLSSRILEYRRLLKGPWETWLEVVQGCAKHGIPMVAPFVFGLGETHHERVNYLFRLREVQAVTTGDGAPVFRSLAIFNLDAGPDFPPVSGQEYLRMVALARLLVPNIPHVASSFLYHGAKVAQVSLDGGADDMGGTQLEFDRAELAAGRVGAMTAAEMERLIRDAGRVPVRRAGI